VDIIDGFGGISRNDQNKEIELDQIQDTHTTDFKEDSEYDSDDSDVDEADGCMGGGLGMILEGRSVENETKMVSKVEEAKIRREEKERKDDHPPPQSVPVKMKISLVQDKIEKVPPLTRNSGRNKKVESEEEEEEDGDLNNSSDVLHPINPSPRKPTPSSIIDSITSTSNKISSALDYDSCLNKTESQSLKHCIEEMGRRPRTAGY